MIQTNLLFGIPIYKVHIDPLSYNKKDLIKVIENNYNISNQRNKFCESDLHHSYNDGDDERFEKINYEKIGLTKIYNNIFDNFCNKTLKTQKRFDYYYEIVNYTASKNKQFMRPHNHLPTFDFAIIHYIQLDKKNPKFTNFHNHNDFADYLKYIRGDFENISDNNSFDNSYLYKFFKYEIKEDNLIIFPSFLKHEIPKQKNNIDKLRITIARNIMIEKKEEDFLQ